MTWNDKTEIKIVTTAYDNLRGKVKNCLRMYLGEDWLDSEDVNIVCEDATDTGLLVNLTYDRNKTYFIPYKWIMESDKLKLTQMISKQREKEEKVKRKQAEDEEYNLYCKLKEKFEPKKIKVLDK